MNCLLGCLWWSCHLVNLGNELLFRLSLTILLSCGLWQWIAFQVVLNDPVALWTLAMNCLSSYPWRSCCLVNFGNKLPFRLSLTILLPCRLWQRIACQVVIDDPIALQTLVEKYWKKRAAFFFIKMLKEIMTSHSIKEKNKNTIASFIWKYSTDRISSS